MTVIFNRPGIHLNGKEQDMSDENGAGTAEKIEPMASADAAKRQRSSIAFPYMDLGEAVAIAAAIHKNVGTGSCTPDQLAPWVKQSPTSSGFRMRLAAGRLFGLIDTERGNAIRLTDLGRLVVDPQREREGRAQAFLSVPLFQAVHDKFKGTVVPPTAAFEKELIGLGVAATLKETARRVLERSAEQAGFYATSRDQLVMPGISPVSPQEASDEKKGKNGGGNGGDDGDGTGVDPIISGLLKRLPKTGVVWPKAQRKLWLQLLEGSFDLIYQDDEV